MKKNLSSKLFISLAMMAAIIIAIVASSLAWYSVRGVDSVNTRAVLLEPHTSSSMAIDTDVTENYFRYMGQTGTEYEGYDAPYYLVYSPFVVDVSNIEADTTGPYFTYRLTDLSHVSFILSGAQPQDISEQEAWDNFSMELRPVTYDEEAAEYVESGDIYRSENGYFRHVTDKSLLSFADEHTQVFNLYIYFQGDVGMRLLHQTQDDIEAKYSFDYSDEQYMFATFTLSAMFDLQNMHRLTLSSNGYNQDRANPAQGDPYSAINRADSYQYVFSSTGFNLLDAQGGAHEWPIAEFLQDANAVDYAYYFVDWASREYDSDEETWRYKIYREQAVGSIADLATQPLRETSVYLYALAGESNVLTFDLDNDEENPTCYMRPQGNFYENAASASYDAQTQKITVTNPTITYDSGTEACGEESRVTFSLDAPTKEGFFFVGWSRTAEPTYTDGVLNDAFGGHAISISEDTTLYAVWKELVYLDLYVPLTWGTGYATIGNISITYGGQTYTPDANGHMRIQAEKGTSAYRTVQYYDVTATATIGGTQRSLTLKHWSYYHGASDTWYPLSTGSTFIMNEETTVVAVWNERKTYSFNVDLYQHWEPGVLEYSVTGQLKVNNAVNEDGYTVTFNGSKTGTFVGSSSSNIVVANIPEGMRLSTIFAGDPDPKSASGGYLASSYDFAKWSAEVNEWKGSSLEASLSKKIDSVATIAKSTAVDDAFIAMLNDSILYAFFER